MGAASFLDTFLQDLRYGARAFARQPTFALIATVTLALGIGANAAIFSVVNAVLLQPLPWSEPDRAVMIWSKWTAFDKTWVAEGEVLDYRRRAQTLAEVAAWSDGQVNLTGDGDPERVSAATVTANIFSTFGVAPMIGRTFTPQEDVPNGPSLVVLSHTLWTRRYAQDAGIVGRPILINGQPFQVLGIMAPGFQLPTDFQNPEPTELWTPLQIDPASMDHGSHGLYAAARLKPGATVRQAADELHGIARAMTNEGLYPVQMQFDTVVLSLTEEVVGPVRRAIWLLFGAVAFLLLIACANVANLLLARAEGRQREIAVRAALGAGGARVVRQLFTESLVLTGVAAIVGLALAFAGVRFLAWWNPANIPRVADVSLDLRVLGFTAIVALVTSVLFSIVPALPRAQGRSERLVERWQPERVEWCRSSTLPECARRRRDGARGRAAGRRRADAAKPVGAAGRRPGLRSRKRPDDEAVAAVSELRDAGASGAVLRAADRGACAGCPVCGWPAQCERCRSVRPSAISVCAWRGTFRHQEPMPRGTGRS